MRLLQDCAVPFALNANVDIIGLTLDLTSTFALTVAAARILQRSFFSLLCLNLLFFSLLCVCLCPPQPDRLLHCLLNIMWLFFNFNSNQVGSGHCCQSCGIRTDAWDGEDRCCVDVVKKEGSWWVVRIIVSSNRLLIDNYACPTPSMFLSFHTHSLLHGEASHNTRTHRSFCWVCAKWEESGPQLAPRAGGHHGLGHQHQGDCLVLNAYCIFFMLCC